MHQFRPHAFGVNRKIPLNKGFKKKSHVLNVANDLFRSHLQQGRGDRRIAQMPFLGLLDPNLRPDVRMERFLVVGDKHPRQRIQIGRNGIRINRPGIIFRNVVAQRRQRRRSRLISRQRPEQQVHLVHIASLFVNTMNVVVFNLLYVFTWNRHCIPNRHANRLRPPAPHDPFGDILQLRRSSPHHAIQPVLAKIAKRHKSIGFAALPKRHRSHPQ